MKLLERSLEALEWPNFLQKYSTYCMSEPAQHRALEIIFPETQAESEGLLSLTEEATKILTEENFTNLSSLHTLEHALVRLEKNSVLDGKELYGFYRLLNLTHELQIFFAKQKGSEKFAGLKNIIDGIAAPIPLKPLILKAIDPEGNVKDDASHKLQSLRSQERSLQQDARDKLENILQGAFRDGYAQDRYFDVRDGRYLLPIKTEHRHRIAGLIYESSTTKATVFVEPAAVREINDKLNQTKIDIEEEIYAILTDLSTRLYPHSAQLRHAFEEIILFDLTLARARFGEYLASIRGVSKPEFGNSLYLDALYHPMLSFVMPKEKIIRNSFHMQEGTNILIISGPNTGGKTVLLKAVGISALMARAGFFLPCGNAAQIPFFTQVLAQIGDEQNLEQSLSSFSASILSLKEILALSNESTLVLIDEILHSTDPDEAAALSQSILQKIDEQKSRAIVTTHLNGLKVNKSERFLSASMEFDAVEMQPTYRLRLGIPGSSRALEIGERLGLPKTLIENARNFLEKAHATYEELLNSLEQKERELEKEREEMQNSLRGTEVELNRAKMLARQFQDQKKQFQQTAKENLRELERSALGRVEDVINEYKSLISEFHEKHAASLKAREKVRYVKQSFELPEKTEEAKETQALLVGDNSEEEAAIKINGPVFLTTLKTSAILLTDPQSGSKQAEILVGNMKMKVAWEKIRPIGAMPTPIISATERLQKQKVFKTSVVATTDCQPELNLIGKKVEEALGQLELFIDKAARSGRPSVRIIHGFGSGALRKAVRDYLTSCSYDISYRSGEKSEGADGCTVVEFA